MKVVEPEEPEEELKVHLEETGGFTDEDEQREDEN